MAKGVADFGPGPLKLKRGHRRKNSNARDDWMYNLLPNSTKTDARVAVALDHKPLVWLVVAIALMACVLGYQLFRLQVVNGQRFAGLAEGNRLRRSVTYAQRGRILDRNGVVLGDNHASFQLVVTPYLLEREGIGRAQDYSIIAQQLNLTTEAVAKLVEAKGLDWAQPLLVAENIDYNNALVLEQKLPELNGFSLDAVPVRKYLATSALANVLGYVSRVDGEDLGQNPNLSAVDFIGKDGIEYQYDDVLRGQNGVAETEVDSMGRPIRSLTTRNTQPGTDIKLSINSGLQQAFAAAVQEQMPKSGAKAAAGVAIDPRSGEVLAMVSLPSYDNNLFTGGISPDSYNQLVSNKEQPLVNKSIGAGYPPGSIIKPLHLTGALVEKVVNENTTFVDKGKIEVPSEYDPNVVYTYSGWQLSGLGPMNARRAIAMSSDIYFYTVGGGYQGFRGMGVERLTEWYRRFGLGSKTGIDLPGETNGRIPTPDWKKRTTGEDWFVGDTYNISIGQGDILTSPLQMAVAESAIVNGGKILQPRLLKATAEGKEVAKAKSRDMNLDARNLQIVREGMKQVIGGTTATATFAGVQVPVAGKSGTAETDPNAKKKPHAWYVAFAPYDNPDVMFALILEGGEGGSQYAAPAIAKAMQWYYGPGKDTH